MTWLQLVGAAIALWLVARPMLSAYKRRSLAAAALLGTSSCAMAIFYAEAIARIPLGMATAIEFIGPLAVATLASRSPRDVGWAALAGLGVALITLTGSGWSGDPLGIAWAGLAALCWAAYILLTRRVGQVFQGFQGLTISLTAAAIVAVPFGAGQIHASARWWQIAASVALGVIVPVLPYSLDMLALRRMSTRVFGILMSAHPAVSGLMGWAILNQSLSGQKLAGIACVVLASVGISAAKSSSDGPDEPFG